MTSTNVTRDREYVNKLLDCLPIGKKIQLIAYPYGEDHNIVWKDTFTKVKEVFKVSDGKAYVELFFLYSSERTEAGFIKEYIYELEISKKDCPFYGYSFEFKVLNRKIVSV